MVRSATPHSARTNPCSRSLQVASPRSFSLPPLSGVLSLHSGSSQGSTLSCIGCVSHASSARRLLMHSSRQGFLIGAILPFIPWLLHKKYGGTFWRKISIPLILHGVSPPRRRLPCVEAELASAEYRSSTNACVPSSLAKRRWTNDSHAATNVIIPGFLVGFASQFYALRYRPRWFVKYKCARPPFDYALADLPRLATFSPRRSTQEPLSTR